MFIVFDIGGTKTRIGRSLNGKTLQPISVFPTPKKYTDALTLLKKEFTVLSAGKELQAIVGGVPAILNADKTKLLHMANLPDWSGESLYKDLSRLFSCPIQIENDATLAALGEAHKGAGAGFSSVAYIGIGTGIGGAWVINGELPKLPYSFDIGHQIINPHGPLCPSCNMPGHLESYIHNPDLNTEELVIGLHNTLLHWPAEIIILGGGVPLHNSWKAKDTANALKKIMPVQGNKLKIAIAKLGDTAGLEGALHVTTRKQA